MHPGVTVVIPSIPPRIELRNHALASVACQTRPAHAVALSIDVDHEGAGPTRTRGLMMVRTEWTAFLDDDDELNSDHLEILVGHAEEAGADVVWGWYDVIDGHDPLLMHEGRQWDPHNPHLFPMTAVVRTELAQATGGFTARHPSNQISGEDFPFWVECSNLGGRFSHVLRRTWRWRHHESNTSGLPTRW
jgi:hypothetical protein